IRAAVILLAALLGLLGYLGNVQQKKAAVTAKGVEEVWDLLDAGPTEGTVQQMFGRPGRVVTVAGWPKRVREIPGYDTGSVMRIRSEHVVPREQGGGGRVWLAPGPRHWVAVCLGACDTCRSSIALKKRSGLDEPMPPDLLD